MKAPRSSLAAALDESSIESVCARTASLRASNPGLFERELLDVLQQLQWSRALLRSLPPDELRVLTVAAGVGAPPPQLLAAARRPRPAGPPPRKPFTPAMRASIVSALISDDSSDSDPGLLAPTISSEPPPGGNVAVALRWMTRGYAENDSELDVRCCRAVSALVTRTDPKDRASQVLITGNAWRCGGCGFANAIAALRVLPPGTVCSLCGRRAGALPRLLDSSVAALEPPRRGGATTAGPCAELLERGAIGAVHAVLQRSVERGRLRRGELPPRDAAVAAAAIGTLALLVARDESGGAIARLALEGGLDTVLDALPALGRSEPGPTVRCLAVLSTPALQGSNAIETVDARLFATAVVNALRRHPRDAKVQGLGCLALAQLTAAHAEVPQFARDFDDAGGFEWTVDVLRWACDGGSGSGGDATEQAHASGLLLLHTFLDARPDLAEDLCRLGLERICKRSLKRRSRRSSIPTIAGRILALLEREVGPVRRRARGDGALLSAAEDSLEGGRGSARGVTAGVGGADDDGCVIV